MLGVAGLAVLGLTSFFIFSSISLHGTWTEDMTIVLETLAGFLLEQNHFARVGGGIIQNDVGADLVGKVEAGIPEDTLLIMLIMCCRNGGGFGSYVATVLAAMVLGNYVIKDMGGRIDDAFGVSDILMAIAVWYSHYRNLLVKITDENAKKAQVQKR
jgi:K(+)-stimulated pyrophosphate-energized sodium pump